jgi:uncharacterized RDD family membrane protein YckC
MAISGCLSCGGELAPFERYCIHCGKEARERRAEAVALARASWGRRCVALAIDLLCVLYLAQGGSAVLLAYGGPEAAPLSLLAPLAALSFFAGTWNGRRTVGHHVMGLAVLGDDRRGLAAPAAALRALVLVAGLAACALPLAVSLPARGKPLHDLAAGSDVFLL